MSFCIIFASEYRDSGSNSDAKFMFDKSIKVPKDWRIIPSIMLPAIDNVWTAKGNHRLSISFSGNPATVGITPGEYLTLPLLGAALKRALDAYAVSIGRAATFKLAYDAVTKKCTLSHTDAFTIEVARNDLLHFIGFPIGTHSGANSYTATRTPNMYPDICIVNWDKSSSIEHGPNRFSSVGSVQIETELVSLFISEAESKVFNENSITNRPVVSRDMDFNGMRIWLTDLEGTILSMQNGFVLKLQFMSPEVAQGQ